ncbi:hypothetical protein FB45DRAFT_1040485 [Roridomyces roridus]|uniref:Uncharacterized protein n=1 Tax=Roridomyces roridus TaxID=1738132 RepID=A0AAD7F9V8_9AGAR|nr:hypothetical protein FB45DRAFT_1040485 [Roridomyces roridus]
MKEMIEAVVRKHGSLDVMVANAGVTGPGGPNIANVTVEEWDRIMNVNARGTFLSFKYAGLQMVKQGRGGRIIGASSIAGKQGSFVHWAYTASKFAVRGLTQSAGITVNAYAPGLIEHRCCLGRLPLKFETMSFKEKTPLKTLGVPTDIADFVSFIASKESKFITGQTISINGGLYFD